jgi:type IV secretory pathway VirB10-like protein
MRVVWLQAPDGDGSAGLLHQVKELQLANTELQQQLHQQSRASGARPLLTARSSAGGGMAAAAAAAAAAASNNMALVQQLQEQQQQAEQAVEQKGENGVGGWSLLMLPRSFMVGLGKRLD